MRAVLRLAGGLTLAALPAVRAAAGPDSTATTYTVPISVVTATRGVDDTANLPMAVTSIDGRDIRRGEKGVSLGEALRLVPGLVTQDRQNLSQGERLTARGLGARAAFGVRGVKVLLDGVPLTTPDGTTQLGNLDLGSIGRIEVLRGPSSSLYGNAGGGVIAIHTAAPRTGWRVAPRFVVGSDGLQRVQAQIAAGNADHRVSVNLRHLQLEGFREHADSRVQGVNAVGHQRLAATWQLVTVLSVYDAPYLLNPSSLTKADAEERPRYARGFVVSQGASKKARQVQGGVTLRHEAVDRRSEVTLYGVDRSLINPIPGAVIDLDRLAGGLRAVHDRSTAVAGIPVRWKAGLDVEGQRDERTESGNEGVAADTAPADVPGAVERGTIRLRQDEAVRSVAPFAAVEIHPGKRLRLDLGARLDRYTFTVADRWLVDGDASGRRALNQLSPAMGISWQLAPLAHAWATVATAFQSPTSNELSNRPDGAGGFDPDLDAESIVSWEAGARGDLPRARLAWEVAVYRMTVDDMLLPFQVDDPGSEAVYYRNAGRASSRGAEVALRARATQRLDLRLAGTWIDFTFGDYDVPLPPGGPDKLWLSLRGKRVPGVPPWQLQLSAVGRGPAASRVELEAGWTGGTWANDINGAPPGSGIADDDAYNDDAFVCGLRFTTPVPAGDDDAEVFLGVDNLFAARTNGSVTPNAFGARYFEPAPGRTWYAGLQVDVGP